MGKKTQYLVELAHKHLPRNYAPPDDFVLKKGSGCYLKDVDGNTYLDMLSCYSAANAGYGNKEIIKAVLRQITENSIICNANCFWEEQKILFARRFRRYFR